MSDQEHISKLFAKAKQGPSAISFDDTKGRFLKSSSGTPFKKGRSMNPRTWIMTAIIAATVTATVLLLTSGEPSPQKKDNYIVEQAVQQNTSEKEPVIEKPKQVQEEPKKQEPVPATDVEPIEETVSIILPSLDNSVPFLIKKKETKKPTFSPPKLMAGAYNFPELTEEQIKANNKRKKAMIKRVNRMQKGGYRYIPSMGFKMDTMMVSVQAFMMCNTEVTNGEYLTFLFDLLIQGKKDEFLRAKPDQANWTKTFGDRLLILEQEYFSDEKYRSYPVVNVSREGAELYCKWLTLEVHNSGKNDFFINDIRLPHRAEWALAAQMKEDSCYTWGTNSAVNEEKCPLANYRIDPEEWKKTKMKCKGVFDTTAVTTGSFALGGVCPTVPVYSYNPNTYGIYTMAGNVAEMVWERDPEDPAKLIPGTAGGGWMEDEEGIKIYAKDNYYGVTEPHVNVGFRVVFSFMTSENKGNYNPPVKD